MLQPKDLLKVLLDQIDIQNIDGHLYTQINDTKYELIKKEEE